MSKRLVIPVVPVFIGIRLWRIAFVFLAVSILGSAVSLAHPLPRPPSVQAMHPDRFATVVSVIRPSVLAIGAYDVRSKPSIMYFGTSFVVGDGNTIATNAHVIEALRQAKMVDHLRVFAPGHPHREARRARLIDEDRDHDLALLRFEGPPLPSLDLLWQGTAAQGQSVGILGYPMGMKLGVIPATHKGVIAATVPAVLPLPKGSMLSPKLAKALKKPYFLYQLDMTIYPGHSGSPVFDVSSGRVLGVINKTLATKTREHMVTNPSGIAYAVEAKWVYRLLIRNNIILPPSDSSGASSPPSQINGSGD